MNTMKILSAAQAVLLSLCATLSHAQCPSWCVNTGNAYISASPSCYGEPYQITTTGEYTSSTVGMTNTTFNVAPGSTVSITFSSSCYSGSPDYYCCWYDGQGNCGDNSCYSCIYDYWYNDNTVTINVPEGPACAINGTASATASASLGCYEGSISYSASTNACGGYLMSGPNGYAYLESGTGGTISNLLPGEYALMFYAQPGGCSEVIYVTVPEQTCSILPMAYASAPSTYGCTDGSITYSAATNTCGGYLIADGGYVNYHESLDGGTITGLGAGEYTLAFYAQPGGCEEFVTVTVPQDPCSISGNVTGSAPSSYGCMDGSISFDATTSACSGYLASGPNGFVGAGPDVITGLAAGEYWMTFYSSPGGCSDDVLVTVPEVPCTINGSASVTAPSAPGCADGSVSFQATTNACNGYFLNDGTFGWWLSGEGDTIPGLAAGEHTLIFRSDPSGCSDTINVTVPHAPCLSGSGSASPTSGYGCYDGAVSYDIDTSPCESGAVYYFPTNEPMVYSFLGYGSGTLSNLPGGEYTFHVVSQAGFCIESFSASVSEEPCEITASASSTPTSAFGTTDGTITFSVSTNACFGFTASDNTLGYLGTDNATMDNVAAGQYLLVFNSLPFGCSDTVAVIVGSPDTDGDGIDDWMDVCPEIAGEPGDPCDDGDPGTVFDILYEGCVCAGSQPYVRVQIRAFLEGPFNSTTGLMNDALRSLSSFPLSEPYSALGYPHVGGGGGESIVGGVLGVTGPDAVVDWVVVELRSGAVPTGVVLSQVALLQRDGDVVGYDGSYPLALNAPPGQYYIGIRHRNHLGAMTLSALTLSYTPVLVDFSSNATATWGTNARKSVGGVQVLRSGDVTFNHAIKYTGSGNDRDPILVKVGSTTPNNTVNGYWKEDVNLNGQVKYTGSGNDRDPVLVNVGSTTPNNVRVEQLP